ncbi:MAG: hypothetical protein IT223_03305 [Crocinitomicaceae bacterium]|nr:hypothetical protein [Crocinitomicaceae bacterium]
MNPRSFYKNLLLTCGILLSALFVLNQMNVPFPAVLFAVVPVYALLAYYLYTIMRRSEAKSPARFVSAFMGVISIKLLLTVTFLGIYIYFFREQKLALALGVFIIYIAYTLLIVKELRRQ